MTTWSRLCSALQVFSERACSTSLRDMLDLVALDLKNNHQSEIGTKQSFNYDVSGKNYIHRNFKLLFGSEFFLPSSIEYMTGTLTKHLDARCERRGTYFKMLFLQVRHFYKKLFFNPGLRTENKEEWKVSRPGLSLENVTARASSLTPTERRSLI